jgi:hypothetical protein
MSPQGLVLFSRDHAPQPPRYAPPKVHHNHRPQSHVVNDARTVHISAGDSENGRLNWTTLRHRNGMKSVSMSSSERTKLLKLRTQLKGVVEVVKDEIREKLKA